MAEKTDNKMEDKKTEEVKTEKKEKPVEKTAEDKKAEAPKEEKKVEEKKPEKADTKISGKTKKVPKTEAVVNSYNAHLSTKVSGAVCRFIVGKTIDNAISDLEKVAVLKKAVPMKGEIPHRKGKIMSGRFPKKTAEHFIKLLKALAGNVNVNDLEEPIIAEAVANIGSRPYGKFGSVRKKRTHIKIIAKNKSNWKKMKSKKQSKNKKVKSKNKIKGAKK